MKKFRKQRYVRLARKMILFALPALVLTFGSCSNEDEVIELTSDDLDIEIYQEADLDEDIPGKVYEKEAQEQLILADGELESSKLSGSGVTRLVLSKSKNFSGSKFRLYTVQPANGRPHVWSNKTYYYKSMVIPPYTNVYLKNDRDEGVPFTNKNSRRAKYVKDLGTKFTGTGRYIKSVELTTYRSAGTESLCGYAYTDANFNGKSFPVFRSTGLSETTLESYNFNFFESYQSISDSKCTAVTFVNTDNSVNTSSKVTVRGTDDNTDIGAATYDAIYPKDYFTLEMGSYNSSSVSNMMNGFAVGVSDGNTSYSQDEKDACNSGYTFCITAINSLNYVATVATKLTCGGALAIWSLSTSVFNYILTGNWYNLGLLAGDAMITAVKITSGLATPIGEFDALICAVGVVTKFVTGALNTGVCSTLKNKCANTAKTTQKN
jgi:hypothetical protein